MKRQEVLKQIVSLMRENNISTEDVLLHLTHTEQGEFDLLCEVGGELVRLPFAEGKSKNPIGIFPFADSLRYIELTETGETYRKDADEKKLPPYEFCERLYSVKKKLNNALATLKRQPLEGCYFATYDYMAGCNWIVGFDDNSTGCMSSDYYDSKERAKIRYVGIHPNTH